MIFFLNISSKSNKIFSLAQRQKEKVRRKRIYGFRGLTFKQMVIDLENIKLSINKIPMMNNFNTYSPRMGQMASSSMFFPTTNNDFRNNNGVAAKTGGYDFNVSKNELKPQKVLDKETGTFPKAMLSHSMIDMNSTSSGRRVGFGKLDSMARKVSTGFQDDALHQKKGLEVSNTTTDRTNPSTVISKNPFPQQLSPNFTPPNKAVTQLSCSGEGVKKRRESIDLGNNLERRYSAETLPFMRRMKVPEQSKGELNQQGNQTSGDGTKGKNFQFLKKRRQAQQQYQQLNIGVPNITINNMKPATQFSNNFGNIKRPEFLNTNGNKLAPPSSSFMSNVQSPEDRAEKGGNSLSPRTPPVAPSTPNFEFKKKKLFQSPVQPVSAKPINSKEMRDPKGQFMTMKERMALKKQRQIKLEDFQLLQKLGKGAFGDVYIAQEKKIGFVCVIKKMSKKRIRTAKVEEHVLREIKIQSYLHNKNLTSLFGYFHDEQNIYLILQALPDGSLQNVKKKKKLPEKQAASIVKQVAEGLQHMHEEYIIHRDLKPENLFVNEGTVKIGDFGCSIYNRDLGLRNTVVGCLQYSSPEQLSQEGYSDKIDSWSLGILTYELLFGKSPFSNDLIKLAQNKESEPKLSTLSFPPGIPIKDETKRFIENLLEGDPEKRMDMDEVLHHEFLREEMAKPGIRIEEM